MPPGPETVRLSTELRATIGAEVDTEVRRLVQAWARSWDELAALWDAALVDLAAAEPGTWPARRAVTQAERARQALDATVDQLNRLAAAAEINIVNAAGDAVDIAKVYEPRLIASQMPKGAGTTASLAVTFDRVDADALASIVARSTEQITAASRPLTAQATEAVRRSVIRGVIAGESPRETARAMLRRVEGAFNGGLTRALTIARTEILDASRAAAQLQQQANGDVLAGWIWTADLSARTCPACLSLHGSQHPVSEPGPLGHQQCLTAGAVVSGPAALASTARWYSGEVVDVVADGHRLTVTPNHPVLTTAGWVAAGDLREGHELVCGTGRERPTAGSGPDDHQVPARIEDVVQAVGGTLPMSSVSMPTTAEDFHGDGVGSEVHVVRADGLLWGDGHSPALQPSTQLSFLGGDVGGEPLLAAFAGNRVVHPVLQRLGGATHRSLGRAHDRRVGGSGSTLRQQPVRGGGVAALHTCGRQPIFDRLPRHIKPLGQRVDRFASEIAADDFLRRQTGPREDGVSYTARAQSLSLLRGAPQTAVNEHGPESAVSDSVPSSDSLAAFAGGIVTDRVLQVGRRGFRGHVYNLQTATGWYVANGIVVHNCRCARTPITKTWKQLGFDIPEPPSSIPDARDWFDGQPSETQLAIMGPTRLAALQQGQAQWADLAVRRSTPGWRDSFGVAPISALTKATAATA